MIQIRAIELSDVYKVYELGLKEFSEAEIRVGGWSLSVVAKICEDKKNHCFVVESDEGLIGFCLGNTTHPYGEKVGLAEWTCVDKAFAGSGIGAKLFFKLTQAFAKDGKEFTAFDVINENPITQGLAIKNEFKLHCRIDVWSKRIDQLKID